MSAGQEEPWETTRQREEGGERVSSVCGNRGYGGVVVRMGDVVETEGKIQRSASGGNCFAATSPSVVNTAS